MSDARAEDQERIVGQPVVAQHLGWCANPRCKDRVLVGQEIVETPAGWCHFEGTCADDAMAFLAAGRLRVWGIEGAWKDADGSEVVLNVSGPMLHLGERVLTVGLPEIRELVRELRPPHVDASPAYRDGFKAAVDRMLEALDDKVLGDRIAEAEAA